MQDQDKTKEQLIGELDELRQRIAELEASEADREQVEEALRASEERCRRVIEASPDAIAISDLKGNVTRVSPVAFTLFGGESENDVLGTSVLEWIAPEEHEKAIENIGKVLKGESPPDNQYTLLAAGGRRFFGEINSSLLRDADGNPTGMISIVRDITDRKQAEEALRESEQRYRLLFERANDAIFVNRIETDEILDVNRRACELMGYTREELLAMKVPDLQAPEARGETGRVIKGELAQYEDSLFEALDIHRDGTRIPVEISTSRMTRVGEQLALSIVRDITERKEAGDLIHTQRDLGLALSAAPGLEETLRLCVEGAIRVSGMDCGGVYLVDVASGDVELAFHQGLPSDFVERASHYAADSANARLVMAGAPLYTRHHELDVPPDEGMRRERLRALAVIPVHYEDRVIACLNIASHTLNEVPDSARTALETIATQIGSAIARSRAEEALRQSQANLQTLFDSLEDLLFVLDMEGRILRVNPVVVKRLGYSEGELLGEGVLKVHPPDRHEEVAAIVADMVAGKADVCSVPVMAKDGTRIPVETRITRGHWEDREALFGVSRDVTERRRAEGERERLLAQIRGQAQRMQQILDTVPEGVLLLDADEQIVLVNPMAERVLAVLTKAQVGDTPTRLGDHSLSELLTSPPKGLWHEVTADGQSFQVIARPIENGPTPAGWVLVVRDVTQQREIQLRIQQQERLAAVGQLAAGIAHDFNNIMATVVLYAQMTARMEGLPATVRERMETIDGQTKHATRLIQQILDFSRRAVLERRPLDLAMLLKEHVVLLERTLPESVEVKLDVEPGAYATSFTVNADPTRMQQMVTNLALNAREAMPRGGQLRIGLERVEVKPGESPLLPEMEPGQWVKVTVSDTGTGIPPDALPHIFEPFFTTRAPLGSGLGLAQVHGIVGAHEGRIDVETQVGKGTTFTIYLPVHRSEPSPALSRTELPALPTGHGETILLVEDNAVVRRALADSLELLNYQVLEVSNGQEALEMLEQRQEEVALVLSDAVMPRMSGTALLHALREQGLAVQVVMLTGHPIKREMEQLRAHGMADWLPKPPRLEQLAQVLARALGRD